MLRRPAVAGQFYKGSADALKRQVEGFLIPNAVKRKALGILAPHAGLMYSGSVAGAVYSSVDLPDRFILIGPNHTGLGSAVSIMSRGQWETPLGTVEIDEALAAAVLGNSRLIREDDRAHLREHSLEVQLPFIQYLKQDFKIVPIQMLDTRLETCLEVGRAVGEAIKSRGQGAGGRGQGVESKERIELKNARSDPGSRTQDPVPGTDVLIVASSDMSHYEPAEKARGKDFEAIRDILNLDPEGLYHTVKNNNITMCGYGPAVAMLVACKILGAISAEMIKYTNSGDVSGDYAQVVGYAGVVIV